MSSVVEIISHYQKSIDNSLHDETRLLHCISKLYKLPISVQHLQETGVGRTVNSLRKYDGEVGVAAKALVTRWKNMVAADDSDDGEKRASNHHDEHDHEMNEEPPKSESEDEEEEEEEEIEEVKPKDKELKETKSDNHHHHHHRSSHHSSSHKGSKSSSKSSSKDEKNGKNRDKQREDEEKSKNSVENKKPSSSSSTNKHSSSSSSGKESSHREKEHKHSHHSKNSTSTSSSSHSSSKYDKKSNHDHKRKTSPEKREKDEKKEEKVKEKEKEKEKHRDKEEKNSNGHKSSSSSKDKKSSSSSASTEKEKDKSKSSSNHDKSKESSSKKKRKVEEVEGEAEEDDDGIDHTTGASFADALAMMGMPSTSKSKKSISAKSSADKIKSASPSKSKDKKPANDVPSPSTKKIKLDEPPPLLTQKAKLAPLPAMDLDIMESLPTISNNYKPRPLNQTVMSVVFQNGQPEKRMTDAEAFGSSMSSRNMRTKIYSGVKSTKGAVIPSLYDLCIRLLQEHIDEIEYTGGIPFYLIKPVIERASPKQLWNLEHHNPYLVEDSDVLWAEHCKRQFRAKQREEFESWREMFWRCFEEREEKLKSITKTIKIKTEVAALPVRKTQMAYVDTAVKPPRNIMNKQSRFGTDRLPVVSPAARVASLKAAVPNVSGVGDTRLRVAPGARDNAQAIAFHAKPRKAPLMQKSLALMKGRFKR